MKKLIYFVLLLTIKIYAQNPEWINYTSVEVILSIESLGDNLWISSSGGLIKFNKITEEITYFNHANANLPDNHILDLAVDSSRNVWVGTQFSGIGRFDGTWCRIFNMRNSPIPQEQLINAIETDTYGNIWAGAYFRYIYKYNGTDKWEVFPRANTANPNILFYDIKFGINGVGWIGAQQDWGLGKIENDSIIYNYEGFDKTVQALAIDKNNSVWIASDSILYKYDGIDWNQLNIPSRLVNEMKFDGNGNLWLATINGLLKFDGVDWKTFNSENSGLHTNSIFSLEIDDDKIIWLGFYDSLLAKFNISERKVIKTYNLSNTGIKYNRVESIAEDSYSNRWVSSYSSLAKFDGKGWFVYDKTNLDLLDSSFTRIYEDSIKIIWRASGLIILYKDNREWIVSETENKHTGNILKEDNYGNIWLASDQGLLKFDGITWKVYDTNNSPFLTNKIRKIAIDKQNNLFISSLPGPGNKGVLMKFDGTNWSTFYTCDQPNYSAAGIEIDSSNNIWLGIINTATIGVEFGGGLKKYDGTKWESYDIYNSDLPSNSVEDLALDNYENLWIATYGGGAAKFDRKDKWILYNQNNSGLPWIDVEKIIVDRNNNKWFGVQQSGLTVFNEEGVILSAVVQKSNQVNNSFSLYQNYPNPFNPTTTISYQLPFNSHVTLKVYDILGKELTTLVNEEKAPGTYRINFNAKDISSGIYFYQLKVGNFIETKKMELIR